MLLGGGSRAESLAVNHSVNGDRSCTKKYEVQTKLALSYRRKTLPRIHVTRVVNNLEVLVRSKGGTLSVNSFKNGE